LNPITLGQCFSSKIKVFSPTNINEGMSEMEKSGLHPSWMNVVGEELEKPYMKELKSFLSNELSSGKSIYPHGSEIFNAFAHTPFEDVKVVIIGQDPYHGPGQAHGLCFSVKPGVKTPPSLVNIYKEIESDLGISPSTHGYLESWAQQGILLLNNVLTVEHSKAASHRGRGWEQFTDKVIEKINEEKENVVFLLWGSPAQKKAAKVDQSKHKILKAPHPSPLSAYRGFFGCKHFSQTNDFLKSIGRQQIDWSLPTSV
jgi:uracil-DNA glycosylase